MAARQRKSCEATLARADGVVLIKENDFVDQHHPSRRYRVGFPLLGSYPVIDVAKGGSINGVINGLNHILDVAVAETRSQGGTWIIPGHGRLCDVGDVASYRNMLAMIRDRVQDMIKTGMTLDQVKAAKPSMDFDGRYGSDSGAWTTNMFVEAVYHSWKKQ